MHNSLRGTNYPKLKREILDPSNKEIGFSFQIHKISKMLRLKLNWDESRISKSAEKEWFGNSKCLLIEGFVSVINLKLVFLNERPLILQYA